jgi:hypothetical protein
MRCPYSIYTHKIKSEYKYKCMVKRDYYITTSEEILKYCDVKGQSAFLTCPRFLKRLRSK